MWLRERAIAGDLGELQLVHLDRFINTTEYPEAQKRFNAVAVVTGELLETELADVPADAGPEYNLIVMTLPDLRATYMAIYNAAAHATVPADAHAEEVV